MCCGHTLFHVPQSSVLKNSPFLIVTDWRAGPSCASLASPRRCRTCQAPACRGHNQELGAFQERMDRDESAAMSTENAERMQQTDDAWNGRDWDAFDLLHDPECVVYWPGREADPTRGGQDHRAEAIAFCDAFPDNKVKNRPYDVLFGEGDFTCFVTRFTGTFTAPMKQPDGSVIEPTGKSFDVLYSTAAKWRDGRIMEEYLFWDNGTFLRQVGLA
jgi:hypothetical protein